ncbi:DUF4476 domain-containing protein [Flavivirga spongiicola]|uniref:DUF4476 domain-containing protein n=1 Tax=Flavivirga spongiicola TaxID=421621 RepID=A0ABU7XU96_9FLAO|nr:DUF4476 domain-containing protein [Flavivirga sp. MEBiC05379]MDO5979356.1 DUF4476 domain-containing protein [Flavivirga sp. MEBiC05379]
MKRTAITIFTLILVLLIHDQTSAQNNNASSDKVYKKFMTSIQSSANREVRYDHARQYFSSEWCTTLQLLDICYYMPNDKIKYQLCLTAYPKIIDKNNFFNIYDTFSTLSYAIRLYHNTQAIDGSLGPDNNPNTNNRDYSSIDFPNSDGYVGPTGVNCSLPMAQNDFNYFLNGLLFDKNDNQQLEFLKQQVTTHCFSTAQIMKLGLELQLEKNRLAFLKFALNKCFDMGNFIKSLQLISHTYYKDDLKMYIEDHLAFEDPDTIPYPDNDCYIDSEEFAQVLISIKDQRFSDRQKEMAKKNIEKKCLSMEQLKEIVSIFNFDKDRLEVIKYLYDYAPSPDKMYTFRGMLKFLSSKQEFDKFLINKQ